VTTPDQPMIPSIWQQNVQDTATSHGANRGAICYSTVTMSEPLQYQIRGSDAASVTRSIEQAVVRGLLEPGQDMPSVRVLAVQLGLSPTTIAAAYRDLKLRGILVMHDRSRTTVSHRPPLATRIAPELPPGLRDLATGNPDPALLPDLVAALNSLSPPTRLYANEPGLDRLLDLAREVFSDDGVDPEHLAVVGGGLDGIERLLEVYTRVGDRVAVEDPCYTGTIDLIRTLGLIPVPIHVDDEGCDPAQFEAALQSNVSAMILTPRAQNPTGAAWSPTRRHDLAKLIAAYPATMVIEVDAAGLVSGADYQHAVQGHQHWAVVRSLSKSLGPDLRVAVVAGDADSIMRLAGRQRLGTGWVSYVLQHLAATVWSDAIAQGALATATASYRRRRQGLIDALARHEIEAHGASGLNVWIPVAEEVPVVQGLAAHGWAVQAGEPFRISADPALRVTIAGLQDDDIARFANDLAEVFDHRLGTRRG